MLTAVITYPLYSINLSIPLLVKNPVQFPSRTDNRPLKTNAGLFKAGFATGSPGIRSGKDRISDQITNPQINAACRTKSSIKMLAYR